MSPATAIVTCVPARQRRARMMLPSGASFSAGLLSAPIAFKTSQVFALGPCAASSAKAHLQRHVGEGEDDDLLPAVARESDPEPKESIRGVVARRPRSILRRRVRQVAGRVG